jgi:rod shape-determining protein MreD
MILIDRLTRTFANRFRPRPLNRVPSPVLALSTPWLSILLASLLPLMPVIASAPTLPPSGLLMLLAWRQVRPGVLPIWAGSVQRSTLWVRDSAVVFGNDHA